MCLVLLLILAESSDLYCSAEASYVSHNSLLLL